MKHLISSLLLFALFASVNVQGQDFMFAPFAIYNDGQSASLITVKLSEPRAKKVFITFHDFYHQEVTPALTADGRKKPTNTFRLYDNGKHGDLAARDNVYSIGGVRSVMDVPAEKYHRFYVTLEVDGVETTVYYPSFFVVEAETFQWEQLDPHTVYSDYFVNIFGVDFKSNIPAIAQHFYQYFPDLFDFLLLYRERLPNTWSGFYTGVRNDVEGIGLALFDNGETYGSPSQLQGCLSFSTADSQLTLDDRNNTVFHEFAHRWGAFLDNPALGLSNGSHWKNNSTIRGLLNLCCYPFAYNGDGSFTHSCDPAQQTRYAPLELYVMGAISADELDQANDLYVLVDPNIGPELNDHIPCWASVVPESFYKVTSSDITAVYGERLPSSAEAQTAFRTATIYVTDRRMTPEEACLANKVLRDYYTPQFGIYTDGRFTMHFGVEPLALQVSVTEVAP